MIRSYDSAWNWARQSLLELFDLTSTVADTSMLDRAEVVKRCYHIANASDKTILPVLDEMISQLQDRSRLRPIFQTLKDNCTDSLLSGPAIKDAPRQMARVTTMDDQGSLQYQEQPRTEVSRFAGLAMPRSGPAGNPLVATEPYLHLKKRSASRWEYSAELTRHLYQALHEVETQGDSLSAQTVLITGAGIGSIGAAMIMHFLQGGARVLVTTSSMSPQVAQKYQALWYSENWQDYLSICGAVIGWTRGTGLMNQNDLVAEGIEKAGMRTFSQEMAYALVCLCVGPMSELCQEAPASCDKNLKDRSEIQVALFQEDKIEAEWSSPVAQAAAVSELEHRAHVRQDFPRVQEYDRDIAPLSADMQGMVDLHRTVVVTGFSELGPHGNARTRWEMEAQGKFSLEGAIEMAWMMGFITHFSGVIEGQPYSGWEVQSDILQETFVNTISAWVNMLLLSASGPIRTPVGACATAVESLELGYDTIVTGKAKFCLVGGATTNSLDEIARGRAPSEMSRPTTTTRNGFMESQGCGLQVLTTADLALMMGLPIRGIVAFVSTSSDKAGRSVPAPGQGVLVNARRTTSASNIPSPLLKMSNRRRRLDFRRKQISEARAVALDQLDFEVNVVLEQDPGIDVVTYRQERHEQILGDFLQEERDAQYSLGNDFWRHDSSIAPLTGALATWGLTIDDLRVASFHGTSTMMNDKNESSVLQQQLTALGRLHVPDLKAVSITSFGFGQKGAQAICVHPRLKFSSNEQS
ncbi:Acyl transferase/acyl hydrolase/lysophospholipase [Penicillium expansum]|nr:Acyl transferase/acyl hydrolase/lysophospholipase [Penicillium expansum]